MQQQVQEQPQAQYDWERHTNLPVGEILRRTRTYYGLQLADVEAALRIRAVQIAALEEGRVDQLPGRVYAIGFIRAYSEFLGLDGDKMVHLFKAQLVGHTPKPELNFPASASESKLPSPFVLLGSFSGLALMVGVFMIMSGSKPETDVPNVPTALKAEVASYYGPVQPEELAQIEPALGTPEPESRVVINAIDNAWVEIRNQEDEAILSRILKKGDSYLVPNEEGMVMDTGNIGVLEIVVDGNVIDPLGEPGDVRRSVSLDPVSLVPELAEMADQITDLTEELPAEGEAIPSVSEAAE